jgi:hypothetical protein
MLFSKVEWPPSRPPSGSNKIFYRSERISFGGCIISHSAAIPIAIGTVVNFKKAHVFEKLRSNFSKTCASKEFYSLPTEVGTAA